ncbi:MAG: anthranilate phosphoribosyltransferase [Aureliella sp.]
MSQQFPEWLDRLKAKRDLTADQMRSSIAWMLSGEADEASIREFLVLHAQKGETADELAGAAAALRDSMHRLSVSERPIIDTCGTGGDGAKTFNISTAAAIAIAACGVRVAKHGNRKITSSTGSADVLAELGINLEAAPEVAERCLETVGICFCFAPLFHPAMRHVGPVRRSIEHPTIFNRLGPLANPAGAECQVLGVGDPKLTKSMALALAQLGTGRSIVVRGEDGVDEVSLSAPTSVIEVTDGGIEHRTWTPSDFGIETASRDGLYADDPASSADCIRRVFSGEQGPMRDVVVLNAAAGLWIAGKSDSLKQCAELVGQAIDSGKAESVVRRLGEETNQ